MCIQIANAARLALEAAARVLEPPPEVDYVEWAKDNIVFSERESPFPGPFNVERFAHVTPILGALSPEDPCWVVTLAGSAQIGKTVIANIFLGGSMAMDPCDFLVVHPTDSCSAAPMRSSLARRMSCSRAQNSQPRTAAVAANTGASAMTTQKDQMLSGASPTAIATARKPATIEASAAPEPVASAPVVAAAAAKPKPSETCATCGQVMPN